MCEPNDMLVYSSFSEFAKANKEKIFAFWVYKRIFTPYEEENCFADESCFEDMRCSYAYIRECIEFVDGDALIGFEDISDKDRIRYFLLSEIRLERCEEEEIIDNDVDNLTIIDFDSKKNKNSLIGFR